MFKYSRDRDLEIKPNLKANLYTCSTGFVVQVKSKPFLNKF